MPFAPGARTLVKTAILIAALCALVVFGRPKVAVFFYNLGNVCLDKGHYQQAAKRFRLSLRVYESRSPFVHYGLALALAGQQQREQAVAEYRRAIAIDPGFALAYVGVLELLRQDKEYEEALALLAKVPAKVKDDAQVKVLSEYISQEFGYSLLEQAIDSFNLKDYVVAQALVERALVLLPDSHYAQYTAGYFLFSRQEYDQALIRLSRAVAIDAEFVPAIQLMADIYFDRGQFEQAIDRYSSVLSFQPDHPAALTGLGLSCMNLERYDLALGYLRRAVERKPGDADLLYSLASVYRDTGLPDEALKRYQAVLRLQPGYPNIHNDLADLYLQRGEPGLAADEFRKERDARLLDLKRRPDNVDMLNSLAYAYAGLGAYAAAEETAGKALAIQPSSRQAYITLAQVYQNTRRPEQSLAALQKAKSFSRAHRFIDERAALLRRQARPAGSDPAVKTFSEK